MLNRWLDKKLNGNNKEKKQIYCDVFLNGGITNHHLLYIQI